jgi:hypothetical protein
MDSASNWHAKLIMRDDKAFTIQKADMVEFMDSDAFNPTSPIQSQSTVDKTEQFKNFWCNIFVSL